MVVYDITNANSFHQTSKWIDDVRTERGSDVIIMLVGNKTDLASARAVPTDQAKAFAEENGISFLEASALNSTNVEAAFLQILSEIYRKKAHKEQEAGKDSAGTVKVESGGGAKKKDGCC